MWELPKREPIAKSPISVVLMGTVEGPLASVVEPLRTALAQPLGGPEFFWIGTEPPKGLAEAGVVEIGVDPAMGLGAALQSAIGQTRNPLLLLAPANWSVDASVLTEMLRLIETMDVVVASRVTQPIPWWRRAIDWVQIWSAWLLLGLEFEPRRTWFGVQGWRRRRAARWLFSLSFEDPESPLRLVRREALQRFPLQSKGSFVLVEMLAKTNHLEALLAETPTRWAGGLALEGFETGWANDCRRVFTHPEFSAQPRYSAVPIPPQDPPSEPSPERVSAEPAPDERVEAKTSESEPTAPTISPTTPSLT